jgi:anti-sigma factor RsiW
MKGDGNNAITDDDLNAFVDGQLDATRRAVVARRLQADPQARAEVEGWERQNAALRALFDGSGESRAGDAALVRSVLRPGRRRLMAAAAAACFVLGGVAGALGTFALGAGPNGQGQAIAFSLPNVSTAAYIVYSGEVRHPVEVGADQQAHLVAWLGKRLDFPLKVPDMSPLGYHLVGGRLLPVADRPGAMFMFENDSGERLTMLVGRSTTNRQTGFRFTEDGAVRTFYWIDGPMGYALSGAVDRTRLEAAAERAYETLNH